MWIFAYGSLISRPDFPFLERRRAFVHGWARRFWQGSPDHRGTPEAPGRVVTLVPDAASITGGVGYRIDPAHADPILTMLDEREKAGFDRRRLPLLESPGGASFANDGLVYVAREGNPHFLGALGEKAIAAHIARSHGPSGANADYARALAAALRELAIDDPHVTGVVQALEALLAPGAA